jgi:hypothetical protein
MRIINIDLDYVLANLEDGFIRVTGASFHSYATPQLRWDAMRGREKGFYYGLAPYPGARRFVADIEALAHTHGCGARILSALPSLHEFPTGADEKRRWVPDVLKSHLGVLIVPRSKDKALHCKPGDVLVDDSNLNIEQWIAAGGIGIQHTGSFDHSFQQLEAALLESSVL